MLQEVLTAAPASLIPDGFDASFKITNNSGVDVMIIDGFVDSEDDVEVLFEQSLKLLSASTGSVIKNGSSATFILNDSYTDDDGNPAYCYGYNLMVVQASNLFPVKVLAVVANFDTDNFDPVTISAADLTAMQDSQKFQQSLQAFPDSILATKFAAATGASMDNSNSDSDIDAAVDAFFAGTDNYKDVTLNSLTAVQTYWKTFPYVWAGYGASKSYYLYNSDATTVTYLGSLDITAPSMVPASIDRTLPGFTLSFTPADNSAKKTLKYYEGQFVDSIEATTIALQGVYQLKSQFTNVAADNMVIAYMSGSVNGKKVLGYTEKLAKNSDGTWSGLYTLLHPKDAAGWMALILEVGAVVMTLELFSRPLKYLWDKYKESRAKNRGEQPSKTEADKMRAEAKGKQANEVERSQSSLDRIGGRDINIKIEININNSITQINTDKDTRYTEDARTNLTDVFNRQKANAEMLGKYSMDGTVEGALTTTKAALKTLDPATTGTADLKGKLSGLQDSAATLAPKIEAEGTKLTKKTSTEEKASLDAAKKANDDALEAQKKRDQDNEETPDGDDGDIEMGDLGGGHGE